MLDNNGKLFGIVNAIDFLACIAIIGVIVFFTRLSSNRAKVLGFNKLITIKIYSEQVMDFVADAIEIGTPLEDEEKNILLGTIKEVNIKDGYMYVYDENGVANKSPKESYKSVEIIAEGQAQITQNGIVVDGVKYGMGGDPFKPLSIRAGKTNFKGYISGIEEVK